MDSEVSDVWSELVECELKVPAKLVVNELMGCLTKLAKNELMDCLTKNVGKIDAGKLGEELVRNELMGSTENGMSERRITAPLVWLKSCRLEGSCWENDCFAG